MEWKKLIQERRSIRSYADRPVVQAVLEEILQDTLQAPTWKNSETGRYYMVQSPETVAELREKALPSFNQKNSANAPVLIVTAFEKGISGYNGTEPANELGDEWGAYDLGLQNAYLVLSAANHGLDTLIMGIRDEAALREILGIPESQEVAAVIALGYRDGEPALRPRKSAEEVAKFI